MQDMNPDDLARYFDFLDDLRESGITNMFGAGPYLREEFDLSRADSHAVLGMWMKSDLSVPPDIRAKRALSTPA